MNVAMFTNTYWPFVGGLEASVHTFTEDFARLGHKFLIVTPQFKGAEESTETELRVPAIKNFNGSEFSLRLPLPGVIDPRMEEFEPEICHSHHPFMLGDAALRVSRQLHIPLVFTHHTLYERYTHYAPFEREAFDRLAKRLPTEYANLCDLVVAPTQGIADLIRERGVTRPIEVVPTGIDVDFFAGGDRQRFRREYNLPEEAVVIGHLGRITREKNLRYLSQAIVDCCARSPNYYFMLVGEGDQVEPTQRLFKEVGLEDRLIATGKLTGQDVPDAYAAMDIFVFASQSDTQGIVLAEAMAGSLPVFALEGPGVSDIVRHNETGILLPRSVSPDLFSEGLHNLLQDKERHRLMAEAARADAQLFDRMRCAKKMLSIYERLIEEHKSRRTKDLTIWDKLLGRLDAEWTLLSEKAAAASTLWEDEDTPKKAS